MQNPWDGSGNKTCSNYLYYLKLTLKNVSVYATPFSAQAQITLIDEHIHFSLIL